MDPNPPPQMTAEQFAIFMKVVRGEGPTGRRMTPAGVGCAQDGSGYGTAAPSSPLHSVYQLLAAGSPKLALARALGIRFVPYLIPIKAEFEQQDPDLIPSLGSKTKILQDCIVQSLLVKLQNGNAPDGTFASMRDYFFNYQSGVEATLKIQGAPRYGVAEDYIDIALLADVVGNAAEWPNCWILTNNQQPMMSFQSTVKLPFAPYKVTAVLRTWTPEGEWDHISPAECLAELEKRGIDIGSYRNQYCGAMTFGVTGAPAL